MKLPNWSTLKQQEGMEAFLEIVNEYGDFKTSFSKPKYSEDIGFEADVK